MRVAMARAAALTLAVALLLLLAINVQSPRRAHADGIVLQQLVDLSFAPVVITNAGDGSGRLFIVDQEGIIRIWDGTQLLPTPFLDISGTVSASGEQGMLGLAFHPDYEQASNGYFYVNYTAAGNTSVITRYRRSAGNANVADPSSALIMKSVVRPETNHNGGALAFGPDGFLYFGMGDSGGGGDPGDDAEDINSLFGKIWRLDVNAAAPYIPASNPFVGTAGEDEIWAMGLRNPWRITFDRLTGDLFIADVGQGSREEINFQAAGDTTVRHYGWDIMEGTICHEPTSGCSTAGLVLPIVDYGHALGCSVTGGYRYRGPQSELYGQYIYGDFCSGRLWAATYNGSAWTAVEQIDSSIMISTFGEAEDGELYVADYSGTAIYRVTAAGDMDADGLANASDNCPQVANPGQQDGDADLLGDPCEAIFGTINGDNDTDNDGCLDGREARPATYQPVQGGDRDPVNFWDFYDVNGTRTIDLQDTLSVLQYFGTDGTSPASNLRDRAAPDPAKPWRTAESNTGVDLQDALVSLRSFGANCT